MRERLHRAAPAQAQRRNVTAARPPAVSGGTAARDVARLAGNRALRRVLAPTPAGGATAPAVSRDQWRDEPAYKKAKSALTTQQAEGVTAAAASPNARPASVSTWLERRVKQAFDYTTLKAAIPGQVDLKAEEVWKKAADGICNRPENRTKSRDDVKTAWKSDFVTKNQASEETKLDRRVSTEVTTRLTELKWNDAFGNRDGFLPGDAGAGGYGEYYAEPAPTDDPSSGFWGQNRVLRGDAGGWWVTADHYQNFVKVTDA